MKMSLIFHFSCHRWSPWETDFETLRHTGRKLIGACSQEQHLFWDERRRGKGRERLNCDAVTAEAWAQLTGGSGVGWACMGPLCAGAALLGLGRAGFAHLFPAAWSVALCWYFEIGGMCVIYLQHSNWLALEIRASVTTHSQVLNLWTACWIANRHLRKTDLHISVPKSMW